MLQLKLMPSLETPTMVWPRMKRLRLQISKDSNLTAFGSYIGMNIISECTGCTQYTFVVWVEKTKSFTVSPVLSI